MVNAFDCAVVAFSLFAGSARDALGGCSLLETVKRCDEHRYLLTDEAYEGDAMRAKAVEKGVIPILPLKCNHKEP